MRNHTPAVAAGLALVGLTACSSLTGLGDRMVTPEASVDDSDTYLEQAGPQSKVDVGGGEEQLLTRFQRTVDENKRLAAREQELLKEIDALKKDLQQATAGRDEQERMRAGVEAETERLRGIKNEQEAKILRLQLRVADLQRTKLQLELADVERQIELVHAETRQAATPASPGRQP